MESKKIGIFRNATDVCHFAPGETIFKEGDRADVMYVVQSGEVEVSHKGTWIENLGEGNIFGRDSGVRAMISLVVELALSEKWSFWLLIEGAPSQEERAAYTDLFHSIMPEEDARSYGRAGFVYKF